MCTTQRARLKAHVVSQIKDGSKYSLMYSVELVLLIYFSFQLSLPVSLTLFYFGVISN